MSISQDFPALREDVLRRMGDLSQAIPDTMKGFMAMHDAAVKDGVLSAKVKELISLGIAIAVHCEGCIAAHVYDALKHGATREEIAETVGVAVLMGGGPATVYGSLALRAADQFLAQK